jgi:dual-specificity kinase
MCVRCLPISSLLTTHEHTFTVFELLSESMFDFMKSNSFLPFSHRQIQVFAGQILEALRFMHSLQLIHTDLKPGECARAISLRFTRLCSS